MSKLTKSAQKVQDALSKHNLMLNVVELSASTRTANDAAAAIGCDVAQIVKSLLFQCTDNNKPILILVSGINRVNEKKIESELQIHIIKADANFTKEITGFAIGGVPPIGHQQTLDIFIDEDLLKFDELWAAAGTPNAVFNLRSTDLVKITNGKIIAVK